METRTQILILGFIAVGVLGLALIGVENSGAAIPAAISPSDASGEHAPGKKPDFYSLGKSAFENGNYPAAIEYLNRALQSGGCPDDVLLFLGRSLSKRERHIEAIYKFREYGKRHPGDPAPAAAAGTSYYLQAFIERPPLKDFFDLAKKEYDAALAMDAGCMEALIGLGYIYIEEKDFHRAETSLENARMYQPDNEQVHRALYLLYSHSGDAAKRDAELDILNKLRTGGKNLR
jgi:Flp pilus assembly protein TadD